MSKTLTITLADNQYEALRAAAAQARQAPEALAAALIAARFAAPPAMPSTASTSQVPAPFVDPVIAVMRANGHLVDPASILLPKAAADIPLEGSPERAQFERELGEELSDALEQSGLSILDLIER